MITVLCKLKNNYFALFFHFYLQLLHAFLRLFFFACRRPSSEHHLNVGAPEQVRHPRDGSPSRRPVREAQERSFGNDHGAGHRSNYNNNAYHRQRARSQSRPREAIQITDAAEEGAASEGIIPPLPPLPRALPPGSNPIDLTLHIQQVINSNSSCKLPPFPPIFLTKASSLSSSLSSHSSSRVKK